MLQVADNASLALNGTSKLDGVQVDLDGNGMLELGNAANSISGLTGSGALNNGSALEITTAGNALYEGSLSGEGSITMNGTGTQVLKGNGAIGQALSVTKGTLELTGAEGGNGSVTYKSLTAGSGAHVRLSPVGEGTGAVNTTLTVANGLNLQNSHLDLVINTNRDDLFSSPVITVQAGDVNLDGTTVSLGSLGTTTTRRTRRPTSTSRWWTRREPERFRPTEPRWTPPATLTSTTRNSASGRKAARLW